jgi:serine/threonine-protein kinase
MTPVLCEVASVSAIGLVGQIIDGRYRVERLIGAGGMGTVWRAQHLQSLQHYALKTLRVSGGLSSDAIQRCLKEARAAAALRSRHVVRIIDVQSQYVHRGMALPYLVMELLEGIDFETVLMQRGALSVAEVVWVMLQVCRGLQLAHDQGMIHRDIKPANLFLTRDDDGVPVVKLCDFGLAKYWSENTTMPGDSSIMQTGIVAGTPRYMAPEQLHGKVRATPALDQWAIGLIAYRLLSGVDYFTGSETAIDLSRRIVQNELPRPSHQSSRVPCEFDAWFLRSCARDPALRFVSVKEQSDALMAALGAKQPISMEPMPSTRRGNETSMSTVAGKPARPYRGLHSAKTLYAWLAVSAGLSLIGSVAIASLLNAVLSVTTQSSTPAAETIVPTVAIGSSFCRSDVASSRAESQSVATAEVPVASGGKSP